MKIKYPGQAVATSNLSSNHPHGSMGLIYEANWTNANNRITAQTPLSTYNVESKSSKVNDASSLGKYQRHLEQIKAFEIERGSDDSSLRSIKEFHGYKPTTLKREKSLKQLNKWDDELKYKNTFHNPLYNHTQNNWHSTDYLSNSNNNNNNNNYNNENFRPKIDPKIKRSQTVIVKQPTAQHYNVDVQGEIDVKEFYRRRLQLKQTEEKHQNKFHKTLSIHHLNSSNSHNNNHHNKRDEDDGGSNSVLNGFNLTTNFTPNGMNLRNCDSMSMRNGSFHSFDSSPNLSKLTLDDAPNNISISSNRMNCYKIANFNASSENISSHDRILLNPLARNRSIKINHFDMVTASKDQRVEENSDDGRLCDFNGNCEKVSTQTKLKKKNSFSRMFYNTISAGSKFPRVFLGRSKSQRSKLNLEELSEAMESQNSTSSVSTLSSTSYNDKPQNNNNNHTINKSNNKDEINNRKNKSGSTSSDSDSFLIPRPRLIVPVHLPRKRRTGNLVGDNVNAENNSNTHTLKSLKSVVNKCDRKATNKGDYNNFDYFLLPNLNDLKVNHSTIERVRDRELK
jgi:hypothetical protein